MAKNRVVEYQPATKNKRVEAFLIKEIKASPQKLFGLACPIEELRWIPDWDYKLVYSQSGINETGCIFTEELSGPHFFGKPLTTTWITMIHDPTTFRILFLINFDQKAVMRFQLEFREIAERVTRCSWHLVFTAWDEEANALEEKDIRAKLELQMLFLAESLKHYCETGTLLP